jgi:hypothetical protein
VICFRVTMNRDRCEQLLNSVVNIWTELTERLKAFKKDSSARSSFDRYNDDIGIQHVIP